MDWQDRSWAEAAAALEARSNAELLRFDQIAELHAVHRLAATFPEREGRVPTPGFDVMWDGRRVEVKAKEPSDRPRSKLYIEPQGAKRAGSDLFWFYLFARRPEALEVFELDTQTVFANLTIRRGTAIGVARIVELGRCLWRDGRDVRDGG